MNFNAPLTLHQRSRFAEGSKLASARDSRSNAQLWKKSRNEQGQSVQMIQALQKTVSQISKQRRKPLGGSMPSTSVKTFQIVSDGGDWYNCYTFDGMTAGGSIIKIAKNQDLRCISASASPAGGAWDSKVIRGITYTYTYNPIAGATLDGVNVVEYTRTVAGSDSSSATSYVTPCLNCINSGSSPSGAGDIITAFQTSFVGPATLIDVTWQALADGRAWADAPS